MCADSLLEHIESTHQREHSTFTMAFKCIVFVAMLAVANAGYLGAPAYAPAAYAAPAYGHAAYAAPAYGHAAYASPALVSQQSNILRTPGNLGQVSTFSKTIQTPYSSVSKSDVRVSNDALAYAHAPVAAYAAPAYHGAAYAAPVAAYAAPAYHGAAYAAPVAAAYHGAAYAAPAYHGAAYAAPVAAYHGAAYASPVVKTAATAYSGAGLLGVAYSAAPAVAHMTYSNGYGINYAY